MSKHPDIFGDKHDEEPTEMDNDLEERLISSRNLIELTLLAFYNDRHELMPTTIEELYYKTYLLLEDYCVEDIK